MRIGIDLGGTKIEGAVLNNQSEIVSSLRVATPQGDYQGTLHAIAQLVTQLEQQQTLPVGVCHPGSLSPINGLIRNANSQCLNGKPLQQDLEAALQRSVPMANDADCFALSESHHSATQQPKSVFGVILGTGVGGGITINGQLTCSANGVAGEWGHNPLPWPRADWDELPGPLCWHGQHGCLEQWLSGPALAADHQRRFGGSLSTYQIVEESENDCSDCENSLQRYEHRLARSLATVINLLDPQSIVLGGGLSNIKRLYKHVPAIWAQWVFSDVVNTQLLPAQFGDSSGVRGAAWLTLANDF